MKELLPIGSVVLLKNGTKRLMICGRIQAKVDDDTLYDYCACYFPEGIINPRELFLFNNEDIDTVYFVGLQDVEEFEFRDYIKKKLEEIQKKSE
ncbi:DUF4176 domain-containing protein [Pseudobacteroides cellulosolvens]|uniref:DUF4176 domain-containing protein n=1 Tax=Pseudobacteroides cellulosolvens ATCC 35603 = DSM 2933 TaxID=398512 RepID=A0A0L6JK56_9FIRM|nr:DUF4176 domain-containing protein [Pseudobacteroides cellulosolvens]KNY26145.1 Protein of unknown function DUF4176 [Pseudobacteroides cellulosolvens ATCC 35603 = DSM 2933]